MPTTRERTGRSPSDSPPSACVGVLLNSTRGVRRLDPTRSYPSSLQEVPGAGVVLTWCVSALEQAGVGRVHVVGGYHIEKSVHRFPHLPHFFHAAWEREGEAGAALVALDELTASEGPEEIVIVSAGTIVRPGAIERVRALKGDVSRLHGVGVYRVMRGAFGEVRTALRSAMVRDPGASVDEALSLVTCEVPAAPVERDAAGVDDKGAVARFVLGTKGETLERLGPVVAGARVPPNCTFTVHDWTRDRGSVLARLGEAFGEDRVVVRSSSLLEDQWCESGAGRFHTELNVAPGDRAGAIENVIASYPDDGNGHQVLVQPMVRDAAINGVMFTRSTEDDAPYIVVSAEHAAGRTDGVTGGSAESLDTRVMLRGAPAAADEDAWVRKLLALADELEGLVQHDALDVEFVVDREGELHLLQVRPIAPPLRPVPAGPDEFEAEIDAARTEVRRRLGPSAMVPGTGSALGVMPDWNPAEIVGVCPRPLALSVYQHVITNGAWARGRSVLGYRDVGEEALVLALAGRAYVDVRTSLASLMPEGTSAEDAAVLVDGALAHLRAHPELHDKIEFELIPTSAHATLAQDAARVSARGVPGEVVERHTRALCEMTTGMISRWPEHVRDFERDLARMDERRALHLRGADAGGCAPFIAARGLLNDARDLACVPFAAAARGAFVATSILRSLVRAGAVSEETLARAFGAIPTVSSEFARDLERHARGELTLEDVARPYGHLRPGTYEVTSPTYASEPRTYFGAGAVPDQHTGHGEQRSLTEVLGPSRASIECALRDACIGCTLDEFALFASGAIQGRERYKLIFTRNVSAALECLASGCEALGVSRDDLSYLPLGRVLHLALDTPSAAERTDLLRTAGYNRKRHAVSAAVRLPDLILDERDVSSFRLSAGRPNFVTKARLVAPLTHVSDDRPKGDLAGRVVLIERADPGHEWLFTRGIAGLITRYGGVASHMAVRCAELGIPAAIGCGEALFRSLTGVSTVMLDCEAQQVRGVS